jgi:polysaccharide export outer membrane protein
MLNYLNRGLISVAIVFLFLSCITSKRVNYLQSSGKAIPAYTDSIGYQDYLLRVGDKLYVRIYSTHMETNELFNGGSIYQSSHLMQANSAYSDLYAYMIQPDGSIIFPMVGEIQVAGMTVREATRAMEDAIKPFLEKTEEPVMQFSSVDVRVIGRYFSVIGGGRAGYYPILREKISIFQALAMAGDIGVYGDRGKVRIIRETSSGTVVKKFDVRSEDILQSEFYFVEPNDVIYIQTLDEHFFSITSFPSLLSTTFSTISFGAFLYNFLFIKPLAN